MPAKDNRDEGVIGFPNLKNAYNNNNDNDKIPRAPEICMHNSL